MRAGRPAEPLHFENRYGEQRTKEVHFDGGQGPHGFLITMGPHSVIRTHFHRVNQFQVFFGAPGLLYRRSEIPDGTVVVHYADAYASYGPYTNAGHGYAFFTLRAVNDSFTGYMPADRASLVRRGRRNVHEEVTQVAHDGLPRGEVSVEAIIPPQDDGLAVHLLAAGAEADVRPALPSSNGAYLCVLSGELSCRGAAYTPRSLGWLAAQETQDDGRRLVSPRSGFTALWMSFPEGSARIAA